MATGTANELPVSQNWVIAPAADFALIIVAPIAALLLAALTLFQFDGVMWLEIVVVFNLAHHLPTFIRIYGDRSLLRRFRWSLLLGPIVPFTLAMGLAAYVINSNLPINDVSVLTMMLVIWSPWHLMMQHYGFMRIYDRHNAAPRSLASRMDFTLTATWFCFVLLASAYWAPDLLYRLHNVHGFPALLWLNASVYNALIVTSWVAVAAVSLAYAGYLAWCWRRGFFVSYAKVLLALVTFGVMWFMFVPNATTQKWLPGWHFLMAFATLSFVHDIQYLAIVWRFNRSLAKKTEDSRSGLFRSMFARGGAAMMAAYVAICLFYGVLLTDVGKSFLIWSGGRISLDGRWVLGTLFALAFTSEILHYYYDGFIWKVRHKENRQHLAMNENAREDESRSWFDNSGQLSPTKVLLRQTLYFAPPMILLIASFWWFGRDPVRSNPIQGAMQASTFAEQQRLIVNVDRQIEVERLMAQIRPSAAHFTYLADLLFLKSYVDSQRTTALGQPPSRSERAETRGRIQEAADALGRALEYPAPYAHHESAFVRQLEGRSNGDATREDVAALRARLQAQLE